jgi:hypothetical protein
VCCQLSTTTHCVVSHFLKSVVCCVPCPEIRSMLCHLSWIPQCVISPEFLNVKSPFMNSVMCLHIYWIPQFIVTFREFRNLLSPQRGQLYLYGHWEFKMPVIYIVLKIQQFGLFCVLTIHSINNSVHVGFVSVGADGTRRKNPPRISTWLLREVYSRSRIHTHIKTKRGYLAISVKPFII